MMDDAAQLELYSVDDRQLMQLDEAWHDMGQINLSRRPAEQLYSVLVEMAPVWTSAVQTAGCCSSLVWTVTL